ncbi:MAG: hypothetical protein U0414_04830 [Polyangiaceae bacterium]
MSNSNPISLEEAIAAARASTALVTDAPKPALDYDPIIGEQALLVVKPSLLLMDPAEVQVLNFDAYYTAVVAMDLVDLIESARHKSNFDKLPDEVMGEARTAYLRDLAQALLFLESRSRSSIATSTDVRVDAELFAEGVALRERMIRVLTYHFEGNPSMRAELANIRSGTGYVDLASDLMRLATHYSAHRAILAKDTTQYDIKDENRARGVSKEIMTAMRSGPDSGIADLRNRCWTKALRVYTKLRLGAEILYFDNPTEFAAFPPMRQAVLALTGRGRSTPADPVPPPAVPASPGAPIPPAPGDHVAAPPVGAGPGGNPLM